MRLTTLASLAATLLLSPLALAQDHQVMMPDQLRWGPAPPVLPRGLELAVLAGDPMKAGDYTIRLRAPAGGQVPPHWHSQAENVTVISGDFQVGMGDQVNAQQATRLPPGGFVSMPARTHHYAICAGSAPCVVQVQGLGPFDIHYVRPEDDPSRASAVR